MPLSEHNSGAGEGDRRSAGSPESSLVGEIYSRTSSILRTAAWNDAAKP